MKCPNCGSPAVTEFKAGSYVCGHCEGVFKHVDLALSGSMAGRCNCGRFAEGACRACDLPLCRDHATSLDGKFLCAEHSRELAAELQAREEEARSDRAAQLPGVPTDGPAPALAIVQALETLVPDRRRRFVLRRGASNRVTEAEGWAIYLETTKEQSSNGNHQRVSRGLLITTKGGLTLINWPGSALKPPEDLIFRYDSFAYHATVSDSRVSSIRSQVNAWRGIGIQH